MDFNTLISSTHTISIKTIQEAASKALPLKYRSAPWCYTNQGRRIYDKELELNCYLAAYAAWHKGKLEKAFQQLPDNALSGNINIVDWGCGQGIASIFLYDYLRINNIKCNIHAIKLIEPSEIALQRAESLIKRIDKHTQIEVYNKKLDDVSKEEVLFNRQYTTFHLFSNILDIEGINLKHLSEILYANSKYDNYIMCVSPFYPSGNRRIEAFLRYFEHSLLEYEWFDVNSDKSKIGYTYYIHSMLLKANNPAQIIEYNFFPPVQFRAGYRLDAISEIIKNEQIDIDDSTTYFDVLAPFDLGASISDDIHPILAVLHNIITRGLPTKASPLVEEIISQSFGLTKKVVKYGTISYISAFDDNFEQTLSARITNSWDNKNDIANQLLYTPIAISRLHKTLIEVIATGRLDIKAKEWNVLVEEKDVPFAAIAFKDFEDMFNHLTALSQDYDDLKMPVINLEIIASERYKDSPLHLGYKRSTNVSKKQLDKEYDLVIHYSSNKKEEEFEFNKFKAKNDCYFAIYQAAECAASRFVYTSERILYKPITNRNAQGTYEDITSNVEILNYFLSLLFRKESFRNGQTPILNKALQNESVIGLLPTGGGKSLTYQLAAMLQPGITIVIDPLVSLMKDQYDGLIRCGIDYCTYINSLVTNKQEREQMMERSELLFVFLSPERLCIRNFRERLKNMEDLNTYFAYGVIDEVHCVSEWGHDFRFSYLHLGRNLYQYVHPKQKEHRKEHIALIGLTATASFDVLADVERELSGNNAFPLGPDAVVRYENTNRLELQYRIIKIDANDCRDKWDVYRHKNEYVSDVLLESYEKLKELEQPENIKRIKERFIQRENITEQELIHQIENANLEIDINEDWYAEKPNRSAAIVFCPHRKGPLGVYDTNSINKGISSTLKAKFGEENISTFVGGEELTGQEQFINGETSIIVATKAFGMGIDKPNVRFTINITHSGSLEAFVQEAGRSGRDRKMSLATILYCPKTFLEQDQRTRLMVHIPVDFGVHKFFYDGNFIGMDFEKWVMHYLLTQNATSIATDGGPLVSPYKKDDSVAGFMETLMNTPIGKPLISYFSYSEEENEKGIQWINQHLQRNGLPTFSMGLNANKNSNNGTVSYTEALQKAIYRMCCVGIIDDYTQDYSNKLFRIVTVRKSDDDYFECLKKFLMRYYTEERANLEMEKAYDFNGNNAMQKCLGYITQFVYSKIATKRMRAIQDIENFCNEAITYPDSNWLEINEHLKDYIYYYFNSKYAREGYQTENGEPFSLTDDSQEGRFSSFELLFKYIRVVDDDVVGSSGSPKDNIKHLQGAVRLIRRALTDTNPMLDLLNAYCLLFLGVNDNKNLQAELQECYINGYMEFHNRTSDKKLFYNHMENFKMEMFKRNAINKSDLKKLNEWDAMSEILYHSDWASNFSARLITK